mgnify:CR=1 FL=1
MTQEKDDTLKVIDTKDMLTKEELQELKSLANMSKAAKTIMAFVIGAIGLFGVDHAITWLSNHK